MRTYVRFECRGQSAECWGQKEARPVGDEANCPPNEAKNYPTEACEERGMNMPNCGMT